MLRPDRFRFCLLLLAVAALPASAQSGADRAGLVVPVAGVALDPVDLLRAENPEQAFAVTLESADGSTLVPEGTENMPLGLAEKL